MSVTGGTHVLSNGAEAKNAAQHRGANVSRARRAFRSIPPIQQSGEGSKRVSCDNALQPLRHKALPIQADRGRAASRFKQCRGHRRETVVLDPRLRRSSPPGAGSGRGSVNGDVGRLLRLCQCAQADMGKLQVGQQVLRLGGNRARQDARAGLGALRGHHYARHGLILLGAFQFAAGLRAARNAHPISIHGRMCDGTSARPGRATPHGRPAPGRRRPRRYGRSPRRCPGAAPALPSHALPRWLLPPAPRSAGWFRPSG